MPADVFEYITRHLRRRGRRFRGCRLTYSNTSPDIFVDADDVSVDVTDVFESITRHLRRRGRRLRRCQLTYSNTSPDISVDADDVFVHDGSYSRITHPT